MVCPMLLHSSIVTGEKEHTHPLRVVHFSFPEFIYMEYHGHVSGVIWSLVVWDEMVYHSSLVSFLLRTDMILPCALFRTRYVFSPIDMHFCYSLFCDRTVQAGFQGSETM